MNLFEIILTLTLNKSVNRVCLSNYSTCSSGENKLGRFRKTHSVCLFLFVYFRIKLDLFVGVCKYVCEYVCGHVFVCVCVLMYVCARVCITDQAIGRSTLSQ